MEIIIIGGGASGFMAAITAAEEFKGASITILEKQRNVLNKVRISGGGRCNVTHKPLPISSFSKNYPRGEKLLKKNLPHLSAEHIMHWFEERGVPLKVEEDGRVFPVSDSSDSIVYCLMETARKLGVKIRTSIQVTHFEKEGEQFKLFLKEEGELMCDRLLVASGGYPKSDGFQWLRDHNHEIVPPLPSLFTFNTPDNYLLELAGVSVQHAAIRISNSKLQWEGPVLITHWGFSGPAILKLSAWGAVELASRNYQFEIRINWTGTENQESVRTALYNLKEQHPKQQLGAHPQWKIPSRLWKALLEKAEIDGSQKQGELSNKALNKLAELITGSAFEVVGKTTFKEEFVTAGGVALDSVNTGTYESKSVKGLYFSGEVLNVDGITGGFNFQHAWNSGYIVGKNIGK